MVEDYGEKMKKSYQDYMNALAEERKKIQVFSRELPLCLDLVNQAIENCKQQLNFSVRSECEDQTSTESPVLEEFIPLKRSLSSEEQQQHSTKSNERNNTKGGEKKQKNVDWMRSVQLWNQTPDPSPVVESKKTGGAGEGVSASGSGAFHPFNKSKTNTLPPTNNNTVVSKPVAAIPASSSTGDNGNKNNKSNEDKDGQRKARRCWSPELHRRFLQALQQLGGSHAATPKQIRELMKVDGLTNDEVKSHLQKYRLHTRRPAPSIQPNGSPQPTQFVVVGGIWVPPPEYSAAAAATNGDTTTTIAPPPPPKGFYVSMTAPQLGLPSCSQQHHHHQQQLQLQGSPTGSERRSSHSVGNDNAHSDSREVTSSSSDTTTASPAL